MNATDLATHPLHLGLGATALIEPAFTGDMAWYQDYERRHADDGTEGRLVTMHTFSASWQSWESSALICSRNDSAQAPELQAAQASRPWHTLNFLPDPHGHGSLRPIF